MTMTLVSTVTVGSGGAADIQFLSIPQTGTDLILQFSGREPLGTTIEPLEFNGVSTGYTVRWLTGNGSSASSGNDASSGYGVIVNPPGYTASTFSNTTVYIPNYSGATTKSWSMDGVNENNATTANQYILAGRWNNTAAITSLKIGGGGLTLSEYTVASLYIVTKGSGGATVS